MSDYTKEIPFASVDKVVATCACGWQSSSTLEPESQTTWRFLKCPACGTYFLNLRPAQAVIENFYCSTYDYAGGGTQLQVALQERLSHPWNQYKAEKCLRMLGCLPQKARLLDFGCGFGPFLGFAQARFDCEGYEISRPAAHTARTILKVPVFSELSELATRPPYSAITCFHVLEHVENPHMTLHRLYQMLEPNGLLLLVVPNGGGIAHRLMKQQWEWCSLPLHNYLFSGRCLGSLVEQAGFTVLRLESGIGDMISVFTFLRGFKRLSGSKDAFNNTTTRTGKTLSNKVTPSKVVDIYRNMMTLLVKGVDPVLYLVNHFALLGGELIILARKG